MKDDLIRIRIDSNIYRDLKDYCKWNDVSVSQLLLTYIKNILDKTSPPVKTTPPTLGEEPTAEQVEKFNNRNFPTDQKKSPEKNCLTTGGGLKLTQEQARVLTHKNCKK